LSEVSRRASLAPRVHVRRWGVVVRIYTAWFQTDVGSDIAQSAEQIGAKLDQQVGGSEGRMLPIPLSFSDRNESTWQDSTATGVWISGVAELNMPESYASSKLVGIVAPTAALAQDLFDQTAALFNDLKIPHEPFNFELGALLGPDAVEAGIRPLSVRIRDARATTLIQSEDLSTLRESMAAATGDLIGVTVRAADELLAVLEHGTVIFDEPSVQGMLNSMFALMEVFGAPAGVLAT
jgi:hypothetical protein